LTIEHSHKLRSLRGASLEMCTSLVELIIRRNDLLNKPECVDPLPPAVFPNLTTLQVSFALQQVCCTLMMKV
jgi:multisubunit Na+/H+ antiporter MnhC subunit